MMVKIRPIFALMLLDAYYAMNFPQPILSVKLHNNTPKQLYEELGRFFLPQGVLPLLCLMMNLFSKYFQKLELMRMI